MPDDTDRRLDAVVGALRSALGPSLVAAYLHGSAVLGGLRPASDLDVLAVVDAVPEEAQRRALVRTVLGFSGRRAPRPGRPVELTVVRAGAVRPWRHPARREFQYGEWLREDYEAGAVPGPAEDPDLALLVTVALTSGRALIGPPPSGVLDHPPAEDVAAASRAAVPQLLAEVEDDAADVLLTLARIRRTLATGHIVTKDEAAARAAPQLPPADRDVLLRARAGYLSGDHSWAVVDPSEARRCAAALVPPSSLTA